MKLAIASVYPILCFVILLKLTSNNGGAYAYKYDDDGYGDEDQNSELGSGFYGDYGHVGCDLMELLETNESFPIFNFPPEEHGPRGYRMRTTLRPEQCAWEFGVGDNCVLEFHRHHFQRGDLNCDEQYLLIGDENVEKRVCGFAAPPRVFNSSGKKLFLSHYRKNGYYYQTPSAKLSGVVRCTAHPPAHECVPPPRPSCKFSDPVSTSHSGATMVVNVRFFQSGHQGPPTAVHIELPCPDQADGCRGRANACSQTLAAGECPVQGSAENPLPDGDGVVCQTKSLTCPESGNCDGSGFIRPNVGGGGSDYQPTCLATTNQTCSWTVVLCVGPTHE